GERDTLLAGEHETAPADATQDDAVLAEKSGAGDLSAAREPRITMQSSPGGQERSGRTSGGDEHTGHRGQRELPADLCALAVVPGELRNRERRRAGHGKRHGPQKEKRREVLRRDRGSDPTAYPLGSTAASRPTSRCLPGRDACGRAHSRLP